MHQPVSEPRRSIYYAYRVHPAAAVPAAGHDLAPVVVVGAGPIGLVTALDLARRGVRCVLLESELQVSEGSRAIVFTRRSMEILQQVGADAAVTRQGLPWRFGNSFYGTRRVFRMEAPHDPNGRFRALCNPAMVEIDEVGAVAVPLGEDANRPRQRGIGAHDAGMGDMLRHDEERLRILIERHQLYTGSARAGTILENWDAALKSFVKVMPKDYRSALMDLEAERAAAATVAAE